MARGMPMRPAGGGGRSQPPPRRPVPPAKPQRTQQQRTQQQRNQQTTQQRTAAEQQRQAAARAAAQQRRAQQQQQYLREAHGARRAGEAEQRTAEVREQAAQLESILSVGMQRTSRIDLGALRREPERPPFDPGPLATPIPAPTLEQFAPRPLSGLWGGRAGKERREAEAREAYDRAREQWERDDQERTEQLAAAEQAHAARLADSRSDVDRYHERIERVAAGLRERDPRVVESYLRTVLRQVPLPASFPRRADVTHHPREERAVVRMVLPGREVVPAVSGYEYAETADEIRPVPLPDGEAGEFYLDVLAQVALLVVRDVLEAEPHLASVTFHGLVDGGDPIGDPPCLVSLAVDRDTLATIELDQVSPEHCLRQLDALVSPDPYSYQPLATAAAVPEPA